MTDYQCYVDGSYISTIENRIGYAFLITEMHTTISIYANNFEAGYKLNSAIAEVFGLMFAMQYITKIISNKSIEIFMDSKYVVDAYNKKVNIIAYKDLWSVIMLLKTSSIKVTWIRGHQNHIYHDLCDNMAKLACYENFKIDFIKLN